MTDEEMLQAIKDLVRAGRPRGHEGGPSPQLPPPASPEAVTEAEQLIGYPLPLLLRRIYLEVANGGLGPGAGINGLRDGYVSDGHLSMLDTYVAYWAVPEGDPMYLLPPPRGVVFLTDWGCAHWTLLDCRRPEGRIWGWEEGDRYPENLNLREWLEMWLDGGLTMPPHKGRVLDDPDAWFAATE